MMNFFLEAEDILPGIELNQETGILKFHGKSCPANAHEFFAPVFEWIDNYIKNPAKNTILEIYLSYFNTVSAKIIMTIMKMMENLAESGKKVVIKWVYNENDEILLEAGEDFEKIINVKFEFISVQNDDSTEGDRIDKLIDNII